ncbi:MAG: cold shock domain-containing protein [Halomonas sp.]|nr:cold shock domain-containing protein [Halomonas sp.]MCC5904034.1 cold shock domain-containing protein [Halomonas sp.]
MLKGTIKSYSDDKKYGFILSDNGESYFFHFNDLKDKTSTPSAGQAVSFDDVPTPKGMAAKKISIDQDVEKIYLPPGKGKFFVHKNNDFGISYEVVFKGKHIYAEARDPDEAYNHIVTQAKVYGFNSLLSVQRSRRTGSEISNRGRLGGHKFTIHCYQAIPALVQKVGYTSDNDKILESGASLENKIHQLKSAKTQELRVSPSIETAILFIGSAIFVLFAFYHLFG